MRFVPTSLPEVIVIEPKVFGDERGFFMEAWHARRFAEGGIGADFVQDNHSRSLRWTLRGIHYQIREPQGKLARVTRGEVFDVAVDLRRDSPTFGHWVGERLSEENKKMLWIPEGFGHAFLVLSEQADFIYKCTRFYMPEAERAIRWDDADIAIDWPLPAGVSPMLSDRDRAAPGLKEAEVYP